MNKKLLDKELQKRINDAIDKKISDLMRLYTNYSNEISYIENNLNKKYSGHVDIFKKPRDITLYQVTLEKIARIEKLQTELLNNTKYGIKEKKIGKLQCWILPYDFTKIRNKKYNLFFMDQQINTDMKNHKGNIYLIMKKDVHFDGFPT